MNKYFVGAAIVALMQGCGGSSSDTPTTPKATISFSGQALTVNEDAALSHALSATSSNAAAISFSIATSPQHGNATLSNNTLSYTPAADYAGADSLVISASASGATQVSATFNITVSPQNDAPVITISSTQLHLDSGAQLADFVQTNDPEGDIVSLNIVQQNGIFTNNSGNWSIGELSQVLSDTITIVASDGESESRISNINVTAYPITPSGKGRTLLGKAGGDGVNLVVMGDGFTESQMSEYRQVVNEFIALMAADPSVASHLGAWNIHMVEVPSQESGADDNYGTDTKNTAFGSGYNCANIERLICADTTKLYDLVLTEYPDFDHIVLAVNDTRYGGSGGQIAIYSKSSPEVALHEIGHSFADLADEYVDDSIAADYLPYYREGRYANVSQLFDANQVPWAHWIDDKSNYPTQPGEAGIGLFEGAYYHSQGFYRPQNISRMNSNNADFGVVSGEQWIISVYNRAGAITASTPEESLVSAKVNQTQPFTVTPLFGAQMQALSWYVNNIEQVAARGQTRFDYTPTSAGKHDVSAVIKDITGHVKKPGSHNANYRHSWTVEVE